MFGPPTRASFWHILLFLGMATLVACTGNGDEPAAVSGGEPVDADGVRPMVTAVEDRPTAESAAGTGEEVVKDEQERRDGTAVGEEAAAVENVEEVEILTEDNRSDRLRSLTSSWNTNWNRHTIDYEEILSGGPPRDGIPSIDDPQFISPEEAKEWLAPNEPVISLEINGDARAYPLQILTWHEIVNDSVGDVPVLVTFCPLCNSALVFDRRLDGEVYEFGTSGLLRHSDLIMYDRTTESLWQQFTGRGIVGDLAGRQLTFLPSSLISFEDWRAAYPDGVVLSRDTGFNRSYGQNPYVGYDRIGQSPFLFQGTVDDRLPAMARVVTISLEGTDIAYPYSILEEEGVVNDTVAGRELVVFFQSGTASALDAREISESVDVGATGVFDANHDGETLTFAVKNDVIVDNQTGSEWNILGRAVAGPLAGEELEPIVHGDHFWFSWGAFKPDTQLYSPG